MRLVRPAGLEPATFCSGGKRSNIRTTDATVQGKHRDCATYLGSTFAHQLWGAHAIRLKSLLTTTFQIRGKPLTPPPRQYVLNARKLSLSQRNRRACAEWPTSAGSNHEPRHRLPPYVLQLLNLGAPTCEGRFLSPPQMASALRRDRSVWWPRCLGYALAGSYQRLNPTFGRRQISTEVFLKMSFGTFQSV